MTAFLLAVLALALAASSAGGVSAPGGEPHPWFEPVSWKPRSFVAHGFSTQEETDHIIRIAQPHLRRSTVVGSGGESLVDNYRTSYGTFLRRHQDDVVSRLEERVAAWIKLPVSHQEDIQVLRYSHSQEYKPHFDSLSDDSPRTATVLIYLSDVAEGGETAFPNSKWADPALPAKLGPFSKCAQGHVAMKPKRGDAIVFHSLNPDGKTHDQHALHTACPVITGVKYVAIFWIHTLPFRPEQLTVQQAPEPLLVPEDCRDADERCADWAAAGECKTNAGFMRGSSGGGLGTCRSACADCRICMPEDLDCRRENRVRAGFLPIDDPGFF